ncbi:Hypothetical predicted protein [Olea europaea subsp. europaea]|uniref:Uncharacterized protein n=1 Tax=Olea europaea subsp. europaea TaxID=158383 RepID=A0A8S0TRV2_OLEEU|nr:Hypothetical predicted protein [Olea europaea subsp. europaea]
MISRCLVFVGKFGQRSSSEAEVKNMHVGMHTTKLRNLEKRLKQEKASPLLDKLVFDKIARKVVVMLPHPAPLNRQ